MLRERAPGVSVEEIQAADRADAAGRGRRARDRRRAVSCRPRRAAERRSRRRARAPFETTAGIPLDAGLRRRDAGGAQPPFDPARDLGAPGRVPVHARHPRDDVPRRLWTMRQYAGFGTAAESQPALQVTCSRQGRPACRSRSICRRRWAATPTTRWRAARSGASASRSPSLDDMQRAARRHAARPGVDVDDHQRHGGDAALRSTSRSPTSAGVAARRAARARSRTTSSRSTSRAGRTSIRRAPSMRLIADTLRLLQRARCRSWNTISISGYHIREAGSDAVQEVAFTLADGIAYVEAARAARARRRRRSRRGSRSSSTRTTTSSRRSPSSAPRGGCGRASCATASARRTRSR